MNNYDTIFHKYTTSDGKPFNLISRAVRMPEDKSLDIYSTKFINSNTAWTIMSYIIYGTIDNWWILSSLNPSMPFYAVEGNKIYYVKPKYVDIVKNAISNSINV